MGDVWVAGGLAAAVEQDRAEAEFQARAQGMEPGGRFGVLEQAGLDCAPLVSVVLYLFAEGKAESLRLGRLGIRSKLCWHRSAMRRHLTGIGKSSHLRELDKWSHVDSNHGPPACEAGALTS